jgi:nucleoside-diphosphate-sugar epimerase
VRFAVVGGTRFIGPAIATRALERGHHVTDSSEITGTLERGFRLTRPHATLLLRVDDATCRVIFGGIAQFSELREDTIPIGAVVTVVGQAHVNADRCDYRGVRIDWGDRTFEF